MAIPIDSTILTKRKQAAIALCEYYLELKKIPKKGLNKEEIEFIEKEGLKANHDLDFYTDGNTPQELIRDWKWSWEIGRPDYLHNK